MAQIIGSPVRYVQGPGTAYELGKYAAKFADRALAIVGPNAAQVFDEILPEAFTPATGCLCEEVIFSGECSKTEIERLRTESDERNCGLIIGIGGGKAVDTAKAVAYYAHKPVIIVPTAASSDAPCSAIAVIYTDDHIFEEYLYLPANPDMVVVDSKVVAAAPPRLLASGMGDALATYFEARACQKSNSLNCLGGHVTMAAVNLARLCYDTLLEDGLNAVLAVQAGAVTPAVEHIIEANTYLSGIGFESGGLSAAHAIHNGLTILPGTHKLLHGEKVAFGVLAMLVLEGAAEEEIETVANFCVTMGLPVTFEELGIGSVTAEELMEVAKAAADPQDSAQNTPVAATPDTIFNALLGADAIGQFMTGAGEEHHGGDCCGHHH